jgi:hypothetical protein
VFGEASCGSDEFDADQVTDPNHLERFKCVSVAEVLGIS